MNIYRWLFTIVLFIISWKMAPLIVIDFNNVFTPDKEACIFGSIQERQPIFGTCLIEKFNESEKKKCSDEAFNNYLRENLVFPERYVEHNTKGNKKYKANLRDRVIVQFTIEKDGSVTNANVVRGDPGPHESLILKVIEAMPNWQPATQRGKPVAVQYNLPLSLTKK